ncbi:hypothetical protein MHTCC0001_25020 [Flavobacteriaceae bacterium MHTCC 0001]
MHSNLKVLAITSLPTVGNAGLKNIISVLGNSVIPIPTLIACGLGNMEGHKKIAYPFEETLTSSFELAKKNNQRLIIYTGYLLDAKQIDVIVQNINLYKAIVETVIVDPVCGDNNSAYVDPSIINNFYKLLEIADIVTPNETELRLLANNDFDVSLNELIEKFNEAFALKSIIITSVLNEGRSFNVLVGNEKVTMLPYESFKISYSGTGDLFVALFIKFHFFDLLSVRASIIKAGKSISFLIQKNIELKTEPYNLLISPLMHLTMKTGTLFYVVGPSGVGKDTLLDLAKKSLEHSNVHFPKRYITRSKEAGGEDHIPISKEAFISKIDDSFFSLWWQSHDNYYGISHQINSFLAKGLNVVVNGSRGYHDEAIKRYPNMKTILITASAATIRERLTKRGRETKEDIEKRIMRSNSFNNFCGKDNVITLNNDSSLEVSSQKFIDILS